MWTPLSGLRLLVTLVLTAVVAGAAGAWLARAPAHADAAEVGAHDTWHCPMHPNVVSDAPGTCPICGMKLVKVAPAQTVKPMERTVRFYRSPMDPQQTSPVPMKDPMGMDFVPVYEDELAAATVAGLAPVTVDDARQQLLGVRTAPVDVGVVGAALHTVGRVAVDETRVRRVNVKVPGYVERVFVDFVGKPVRAGQALFSMYSPEVLAAENELLAALRAQAPGLVTAARRKLELWDVPPSELARLEREGTASRLVTVVAPVSGVVTKKDVVEGSRLEAGAMPYELTDLSTLWVWADVYEPELRFVELGADATVTLAALPGTPLTGKVLFIDPLVDARTRTARVRIALANPTGALKPEMYGEVTLARPARAVLRVPTDAVIPSGRSDVVFVATGGGHFTPREVTLGERGRAFCEVLSGLTAGEVVVTRGTFLIDSESRLRASLARTAPGATR